VWRDRSAGATADRPLTRPLDGPDGHAAAIRLPRAVIVNSDRAVNHRQANGARRGFSRVCFFRGPVMMGRPPRAPIDLQAVTRDVKACIRRVIGELEAIEQQQDPILASPRDVYIDLDMAIHQLESAMSSMRKARWP